MKRSGLALVCGCLLAGLWLAGSAHAQQFVVVDETYTATAMNTNDSHFDIAPKSGIPADWTKPTNYAMGKAYVELEILEKPSDVKTLYNICFVNSANYACMPYAPTYTTTGPNPFNQPFSSFYQNDVMDWSKGVSKVQIVLKDEMQTKKQGDANFYPMKAHVTISIVAPGATYVKPTSGGSTAGSGGSAMPAAGAAAAGRGGSAAPRAGSGGTGGRRAAAGSGGAPAAAAGMSAPAPSMNAGSGGKPNAAGSAAAPSAGKSATPAVNPAADGGSAGTSSNMLTPSAAGSHSIGDQLEDSSGCSATRVHRGGTSAILLLLFAPLAGLRKRRRGTPRS